MEYLANLTSAAKTTYPIWQVQAADIKPHIFLHSQRESQPLFAAAKVRLFSAQNENQSNLKETGINFPFSHYPALVPSHRLRAQKARQYYHP